VILILTVITYRYTRLVTSEDIEYYLGTDSKLSLVIARFFTAKTQRR